MDTFHVSKLKKRKSKNDVCYVLSNIIVWDVVVALVLVVPQELRSAAVAVPVVFGLAHFGWTWRSLFEGR
jgi:hypothetical protein